MHATVNDVNRRKTLRNVVIFTVAVWSVGWIAAVLVHSLGATLVIGFGALIGGTAFVGSMPELSSVFLLGLAPSLSPGYQGLLSMLVFVAIGVALHRCRIRRELA